MYVISTARTLGDEHKLRVFGNKVQKRIFGHDREEVRGGRRELYEEELHYLCFLVR
jgi:hypothetical protein